MPDTLLEIITRLQQPGVLSLVQGRRLLLDYARKQTRSRLGLLFLLDPAGQQLMLVEQCGWSSRRPVTSDASRLPADGAFASVLQQSGLVYFNESDNDPRVLPAERFWARRGERILLHPVVIGDIDADKAMRKGLMALITDARASTAPLSKQAEQDVSLCAALLGSYLDASDGSALVRGTPRVHKGHPYIWADRPIHSPEDGWGIHLLAALYEIGLVRDSGGDIDEQEICQQVMDVLKNAFDAVGGSLWLYTPSREQFVRRANAGEVRNSVGLVEDVLAQVSAELRYGSNSEELAREGPRVITWSAKYLVLLHFMTCGVLPGDMVGAVALVIEGRKDLSDNQRLLLAPCCRAAALVIRGCQQHKAEQQAIIDEERSRIARDIHDGAAQQIAQAIHTLEYAGRISRRQPGIAMQEVERARATLVESLNSLRQSIASLLPAHLEQSSLGEALGALLDEFRRSNPAINVLYEGYERVPGKSWLPSLEAPVYRLIQEALQNVRKHAHASQVTVQLQMLPGMLVAQVSDNGLGFDYGQVRQARADRPTHFGLRSMQERVEQVGGIFALTSKPGMGTTVKASFPLPTRAIMLTSREREVLHLLVEGASNRVIADRLSVSIETVKSHMRHIMQKLGVKDRTQAAVLAARQQWV